MTEWKIRAGEEDDVASVLELWRAAGSVPSATDSEDGLARLLATDRGALLVAEGGGELIGSLIAAWDGWRGSFYRLAVHPEWRRRGLATALVEAGERRLSGLGAVRLTAIAVSDEAAATGFSAAAGYERQSNRSRFVRVLAN